MTTNAEWTQDYFGLRLRVEVSRGDRGELYLEDVTLLDVVSRVEFARDIVDCVGSDSARALAQEVIRWGK